MRSNYKDSIDFVFKYEGGYSNHPSDPGGPTNWGITIHDARKYWKSNATAEDVKAMPKEVAADIYREHYAKPTHFDDIAPGLDFCTLDAAVNSGTGRADKWLAKAINSTAIGYSALATETQKIKDLVTAVKKYQATRLSFLHALKTWSVFGKGWSSRVASGEALGVRLALQSSGKSIPEVKKELEKEAKSSSNKATAGTTAGAGTAAGTQIPVEHLGTAPKYALMMIGIAVIFALGWFIVQNVHKYKAYKSEMLKV